MRSKYPKILVISAWYPNRLCEAEGDFVRYQSKLLFSKGLNIEVFHANLSIRYLLKGQLTESKTQSKEGLPEHIIEYPYWPRNNKWGIQKWARRYVSELKKYCSEHGWPDVIHAHTYLGGYCAGLLKETTGVPYVLTLHESQIVSNKVQEYHRPLLQSAITNADIITSVGEELRQKTYELSGIKPLYAPNFIDFELFQISEKKYDFFTFVFVGELIERKRVDMLIDVMEELFVEGAPVSLQIVGSGPEEKDLIQKSKRGKSKDNIHFNGRKSQKEVAKIMALSHCMVLPSKAETFGIVLLEALACGVPFISTRSGVPEKRFDHDACHFIGHNKKELYTAMKRIIGSWQSFDAVEIRKFTIEKFNTQWVIEKYREMYLSIADKRKPQ